jgi:AcrR family transcriptional regulator
VAHELFYWHGIRATGIDTVAAEAAVAPTTLYRLFGSKDGLVAAYLERNDEGYQDWLTTTTDPSVGSPRERILALFDALAEQTRPERCRGCPFLMALAEYPDPDSVVHATAVATKERVRSHLQSLTRELAAETAVADPSALADQLALVLEGVYGSVQALGPTGPAARARSAAIALIQAAEQRA